MFQKVFKSCTEPAAGAVPSAYATAVTTVRLPAEEEGAEIHSCCRPEDLKDGKCEWSTHPRSVFFICGGVDTSLPIFCSFIHLCLSLDANHYELKLELSLHFCFLCCCFSGLTMPIICSVWTHGSRATAN